MIDLARSGEITICTSPALIAELIDVLIRPKFATSLLTVIKATAQELVDEYIALVEVVEVENVELVVIRDPDDDEVVACAIAANASYIISGDSDLLNLGTYRDIRIITANAFLTELTEER